jgi:hypothetical protein
METKHEAEKSLALLLEYLIESPLLLKRNKFSQALSSGSITNL